MKPLQIFERFYIVDDFYLEPDRIRNYAISLDKETQTNGNYAGIMTETVFLTKEHLEIIGALVGHEVKPSSGFTGRFRFTKENEIGSQDIHFDPAANDCVWAGVCYLTPDTPADTEGTVFWKHRRTGLESIPRTEQGLEANGWSPELLKDFLSTEGVDYSKWESVMTIPYKYNRLVLFRPWRFHSPGKPFGDTIENSRLVQTFFFSPAGDIII